MLNPGIKHTIRVLVLNSEWQLDTEWHTPRRLDMWIENDWKTQKARENLKRWDRLSTDDQHSTIGIYIGYYRPGGLEDLGRHLKQDRGWERGEIKKWITTNNPSWDQGDLRNSSILIVTLWKDQESWFSRRSAQAQGADCQKSQASAECAECAEGAECSGEGLAARCSKAFHGFSRSCRIQGAAEQIKERLHLYSRSRCGCFQSTPQLHSKPVHSVHCVCVGGVLLPWRLCQQTTQRWRLHFRTPCNHKMNNFT